MRFWFESTRGIEKWVKLALGHFFPVTDRPPPRTFRTKARSPFLITTTCVVGYTFRITSDMSKVGCRELQSKYTDAMDDKIITAIVAAISAVIGGVVTTIFGPVVKHRLGQSTAETTRKREQIYKWRQMLLEVNRTVNGNIDPREALQVHPDYITLEPFLSEEARRVARGQNRTFVVGQVLSLPLETLKNEIARVESEWKLRN